MQAKSRLTVPHLQLHEATNDLFARGWLWLLSAYVQTYLPRSEIREGVTLTAPGLVFLAVRSIGLTKAFLQFDFFSYCASTAGSTGISGLAK